jgi:hypothetical protein
MQEDTCALFKGLYIEHSPVWQQINTYPVFVFDFKDLDPDNYKQEIYIQVMRHIESYIEMDKLTGVDLLEFELYKKSGGTDSRGIHLLTRLVYNATGKQSYLLVDEYDGLLINNYLSDEYPSMRQFMTRLLGSAMKGNNFLAKAVITGVMRISNESILSGWNNIRTYDVFNDDTFNDDYGLTVTEVDELDHYLIQHGMEGLDRIQLKEWYNGITVGGQTIYNIYSTMFMIQTQVYKVYWLRSGAISIILRLLDDFRLKNIVSLLQGESITVEVLDHISLEDLRINGNDYAFYSLLVQSGYLAIVRKEPELNTYVLTIPNKEIRMAWREFIIGHYPSGKIIRDVFQNLDDINQFSKDLQRFMTDRLSHFDLATKMDEDKLRTTEHTYHIFLLGLVANYGEAVSNRESGDGRYDILLTIDNNSIIFELKATDSPKKLDKTAQIALKQIKDKRYADEMKAGQTITLVGMALYGKQCRVLCVRL